ncbi:hypothetical protein [Marinobacter sp. F4206]|uniref:hypothetical protein n=1 Tax=Marinobacter sp. F4206 TaxID=2861777 RepID=UPI001C5EF340|nr:hypothetical protein [Marinobacter sp. F4206]MBW4934979.1 hypothetical protein [Marinobacter sp. F4206]
MNLELNEFLTTLLSSALASAVLSGAIIWLARTWIAERLRQSIQHEYDQNLARLNSELQAEADKNALLLKNSFEQEAERLRFATSSISSTQKIAIERKLDGVETLWDAILLARKNVPAIMGFIDILTVDEYKNSKNHPDFKQLVGEVSIENMTAMYKDNVGSRERIRPYVGEYLWALLSTYQASITRVALVIHWGDQDEKKLNWHLDGGVRQLINSFLSQTELEQFEKVNVGKIGWLQRNLEQKILAGINVVISGQKIGDEALEQAQRMEQRVRELKVGSGDI